MNFNNSTMSSCFKRILAGLLLMFSFGSASSQNVVFEVDVPPVVSAGTRFRVDYNMNVRPDSFVPPNWEGFDILAGPTHSYSENHSIVNGVRTSHLQVTYAYVIIARNEGKFTIPAAKIVVDGKEYTSKPQIIEVVKEDVPPNTQQGGQAGQTGNQTPAQRNGTLADDAVLLIATVDKTNVYKGQPIRLYFKLCVKPGVFIAGIESIKPMAFDGFWTDQLDTDRYRQQREAINNQVYETRIMREYLLFPQQSGNLQINPMEMVLAAQTILPTQARTIFDDFFGGGPEVQQHSVKVLSAPKRITVKELPVDAPDGFNGAVGNFTMSSDFPEDATISANTSANYTVRITGSGNLPLIQAPRLDLPDSFEQYNVKTTESINKTTAGITGYRQFEYPFIARSEGEFPIEPVVFSYFNPETGRYVTLRTPEYHLSISPDSTAGSRTSNGGILTGPMKEDLTILGEDIRFIKMGKPGLKQRGEQFMGSGGYHIALFAIIAAFVGALIYLQKKIKELRNTELIRGKKANKVALQRLRAAEKYMREGNQRNYYEEMLKALWGYMSDKLNIPAARLTKENIREELVKRNIESEYIAKYTDLISDCEYAQYSPSGSGHMQEIYSNAVSAISKFESLIKR